MKKSLIFKNLFFIMLVGNVLLFTSCIKNRNTGATDFSLLTPIVQIIDANGFPPGLANFSKGALLSDVSSFRVNFAATNTAPADITVTLAYDANALAQYVSQDTANRNNPYTKFPDSIYSFPTTSLVIKAGKSYSDAFATITLNRSKIDPSKNYMLPISITAAGGYNISGNFGTMYYHLIGNPLAGNYNVLYSRWNYTGSIPWNGPAAGLGLATSLDAGNNAQPYCNPPGNPPSATFSGTSPKAFAPVNGQTVQGVMGNVPDPQGGSAYYFVTANSNFTSITYDFAASFYSGYSNADRFVRGYVAPGVGIKPAFRLISHYNNALGGGGNDRITDETFVKQ